MIFFMRKLLFFLSGLLMTTGTMAQTVIKGKVSDNQKHPVQFATVVIEGTTEGAFTDSLGEYSLSPSITGKVNIKVMNIGYKTDSVSLEIENGKEYKLDFILKSNQGNLNELVVTAGAFEANNDRKVAVLRPMDIYTTAGGGGDIVGAIQTLPGTQKVSNETGLFVRGGDATESATIVDGLVMQNAFFTDVPGVAQRSRFAPYQFKGISFSSGGYSARYGEALSGILELNTNDLPEKSTLNLGLNQGGITMSGSKLNNNSGIEGSLSYTNLQPFYNVAKTNINFYKPPVGLGGSVKYTWTNANHDLFKLSLNISQYESGTDVLNPLKPDTTLEFSLKNVYSIANAYYKHFINDKTYTTVAASYSDNNDFITWGGLPGNKYDSRLQGRAEILKEFPHRIFAYIGTEVQRYSVQQTYDTLMPGLSYDTLTYKYHETLTALYSEAEWKALKWLGIKAGIRYEYSALLGKSNVAPRLTAATRLDKYGQVSVASGIFYQNAADKYLLAGRRPDFQQAVHYIANYQYTNESRTFRIEGYYKSYNELVKELQGPYNPNPYRLISSPVDNSGNGYAQGIDIFWRDKKSIRNLDYWISYSYIDTKRNYENYPTSATPDFISNNNLNIVGKYAIGSTGFNISSTYSYASGRRYYDPGVSDFLSSKAPDYQNLAVTLNYIFTINRLFSVAYISLDNVTDHKNILGYRYSYPNYDKYPILPAMYRSVFVGIMLSLTEFKKEDL